jgi:DNA-binding transcriptional ArsR family regulator
VHRFQNPRSIRALAHPARLAIIDALAAGEELTATQCAELTGLSPSATAYHLKLLERYGFAETAPPRPDRRERPWRATRRQIQVDLDPPGRSRPGRRPGFMIVSAFGRYGNVPDQPEFAACRGSLTCYPVECRLRGA